MTDKSARGIIAETLRESLDGSFNSKDEADAILAALEAGGFAVVPKEPTEAMLDKGEYANSEWLNDNAPLGQARYRLPAKAVWSAMLAASNPKEEGK